MIRKPTGMDTDFSEPSSVPLAAVPLFGIPPKLELRVHDGKIDVYAYGCNPRDNCTYITSGR